MLLPAYAWSIAASFILQYLLNTIGSCLSFQACAGAGHDPKNPEYSILKQRLARRLQTDGASESDIKAMDLVFLTKVACLQ